MKLISLNHAPARSLDDSMIPAINIVFLLLIFFMVAGQIQTQNQDLVLPESESPTELHNEHALIEIDKQGHYFFQQQFFTDMNSLSTALRQAQATSITLRIHKELNASVLDPFIDLAKATASQGLQLETSAL